MHYLLLEQSRTSLPPEKGPATEDIRVVQDINQDTYFSLVIAASQQSTP